MYNNNNMEENRERELQYFEHRLTPTPSSDTLCHICNLKHEYLYLCDGILFSSLLPSCPDPPAPAPPGDPGWGAAQWRQCLQACPEYDCRRYLPLHCQSFNSNTFIRRWVQGFFLFCPGFWFLSNAKRLGEAQVLARKRKAKVKSRRNKDISFLEIRPLGRNN